MSPETVCFRKKLSIRRKQKDGQPCLEGSQPFSWRSPGSCGSSLASMLHSQGVGEALGPGRGAVR